MEIEDFVNRWSKARVQAIQSVFPWETTSSPEESVLENIPLELCEEVLRQVFLNSRRLAVSYAKYQGLSFELQDFQNLLHSAQNPCFQGVWSERSGARVLSRPGCGYAAKAQSFACDYWREAVEGLIMGLGEDERLARHGCARHDGGACVDVLFSDSESAQKSAYQFGPIPEPLATELSEIGSHFKESMKTRVEFLGYSAGTLFFQFPEGASCGSGTLCKAALTSKIQKKHPHIRLQDISPRAVMGPET